MFQESEAFSGFSTDNVAQAKAFYGEVLGLDVAEEAEPMPMLTLSLKGGGKVLIYPRENHVPAEYTVLNFPVSDIDAAAETLKSLGISLEHYEGLTDKNGIARGLDIGRGPNILWFKDPAGNILSALQDTPQDTPQDTLQDS